MATSPIMSSEKYFYFSKILQKYSYFSKILGRICCFSKTSYISNIFYSSKILLLICCFSKILLGIWCFSKSLWKLSYISQKSFEKYFLFPKNPPKNTLFFSKKNPFSCATLRIVSFRLNSCFFRQALIVDKCRFLQRCFYHRSNFMWGHWRWYVLHQHLKIFLNILDILWGHWRRYVLHQPICLPVREGRA